MKWFGYALTAFCFAQTAVGATIERTIDAAPNGKVEIVNVAGTVEVSGWDRPQVALVAQTDARVDDVVFARHGDRVEIRVKSTSGRDAGEASLKVRVPQRSDVLINTVSASQTIEGVQGEQDLQSVSGNIRTQIAQEDLQARSVSGSVEVRGSGPTSVRVTTVNGTIQIRDVGGEVDLSTVTGSMRVEGGSYERARLKTTNGDIRFNSALEQRARVEAEAINGTIRMDLREPVDAEFDIETFNGLIHNCFGPKPRRTNDFAPGSALRFKEGNGSARVRLKTLNGTIDLCKK